LNSRPIHAEFALVVDVYKRELRFSLATVITSLLHSSSFINYRKHKIYKFTSSLKRSRITNRNFSNQTNAAFIHRLLFLQLATADCCAFTSSLTETLPVVHIKQPELNRKTSSIFRTDARGKGSSSFTYDAQRPSYRALFSRPADTQVFSIITYTTFMVTSPTF
jgi:hypothetical protein